VPGQKDLWDYGASALMQFGEEVRREEEGHDGQHPVIAAEGVTMQTDQSPQIGNN
jgi:hypothetical protein